MSKHFTSVDQSDRLVPYNLRQSGETPVEMLIFTSSAERYIKQAIECGFFEETDWKKWKQEAKTGQLIREERIEMGKRFLEKNYIVLVNESGRGGRYVVESNPFPELDSSDF